MSGGGIEASGAVATHVSGSVSGQTKASKGTTRPISARTAERIAPEAVAASPIRRTRSSTVRWLTRSP
jgi:hypothetical protein